MTDTATPEAPPTTAPPPDVDDDGQVDMPESVDVAESKAVATIEPDVGALEMSGPLGGAEFQTLAAKAVVLSRSSLVPKALQGRPHDVLLVLWSARDLGLAETLALRKLYPIDGQVTIAPQLKMALVNMRGAGRVWFENDNDGTVATVHGQRTGDAYVRTVTVTMADMMEVKDPKSGKKLVEKPNWKSYPARMLQWRAVGWLVDDLWPEIALGIYTPDELGAFTDEQGEPLDVESAEVPAGYGRPESNRPDPDEPAADDVKARLQRRVDALPDYCRKALGDQWMPANLPKLGELRAIQVRRAEALINAQVSKAKSKGDWTEPEEPAEGEPPAASSGQPVPVEEEPILCGHCGCDPCECAPDDAQVDEAEDLAEAAAAELLDEPAPHGAEQSDRAPEEDDPTRPF